MKKWTYVFLVLLLANGLSAQALRLESFRHQATFVIRDDLDYAIDGTDLLKIDGARIFTNLSNLSSGNEQIMGYNSDNTFVIGYVTPEFLGFKSAFFLGNLQDLDPAFLSLDLNGDGSPDISGHGFLSGTWNREWDANGDGSIDFIDYRYIQAAGEQNNREKDLLINIARELGGGALAFVYKRISSKSTGDSSDSLYFSREDYSTTDLTEFNREDNSGNLNFSSPSNEFRLSLSSPFMNWELRGDAYLNMARIDNSNENRYHYFEDLAPSTQLITDTYLDTTYDNYTDNYARNEAGVELGLENIDPYLSWWITGNFGFLFGSGNYENSAFNFTEDHSMNAGNVDSLYTTDQYSDSAPISVSGMNLGISGRMEWQISKNVRFGLGVNYGGYSSSLEYDHDSTNIARVEYNDGDADPSDPDDYLDVTQSGARYTETFKTVTNVLEVPAGIEINIGKKKDWFVRFGALARKVITNGENTTKVNSVDREVNTYITGDGDTTVTYQDIEFSSHKENTYSELQTVDFSYGLGWKPSENLRIDLIGMFDLPNTDVISTNWFRSLKLSATVLFK